MTHDLSTSPSAGKTAPGTDEVSLREIERVVSGQHHDPHSVLGAHLGPHGVTIRALRPLAESVTVVLPDGSRFPATHRHQGVFEATLPEAEASVPDYLLEVTYPAESSRANAAAEPVALQDDRYRHLPTLGEFDLHLISEGRHEQLWRVLGARPRGTGTAFAVWAPNARGVRLTGDFNFWDGRAYPMRSLGGAGLWELYVPGVGPGTRYKYSICGPDGVWRGKAAPMAPLAETPPATASVVCESGYEWADEAWMTARAARQPVTSAMSVYEVHLGSWRPGLSYRELAGELAAYVQDMGFTHVEFMPVAEHPFGGSWGYQVTSYYAPTSRYGSPDDFRYLIDTLHQAGIGVIVDWVPAHFPRDSWALAAFDGTPLYEHEDPRMGAHPDWGTLVFNYGRHEVQNFLLSNALFWIDRYHIDGLRVDAVASMLYLDYSRQPGEWIPNAFGGRENLDAIAFLKRLNEILHARHPGALTIAEESTSWPAVSRPTYVGGLGFDLKWNMGWMNDVLKYFAHDPIHRKFHHGELTFSMLYAFNENFILPLSHDEVVHGKRGLLAKMPGDDRHKFANLRLLFGYFYAHPGKKLLFMGCEIAQWSEWWENASLDWHLLQFAPHQGIQRLVTDLNHLYAKEPALHDVEFEWQGFEWLEVHDEDASVLAFLRRARRAEEFLIDACNFTPVMRENYRVGVPEAGYYREILNTDSEYYTAGGAGNSGGVRAEPVPWSGREYSIKIQLPPLSVLYFKPQSD